MTDCQYFEKSSVLLGAYHDGELDAVASEEIRRHLAACPHCSGRRMDLDRVSRAFADAVTPRLSQIRLRRLHANVEFLFDSGLLRLARVMTGLAATVLVAGSLWLIRSRPPAPVTVSVTQMALQLEEQSPAVVPEPSPSDWIVAELSH